MPRGGANKLPTAVKSRYFELLRSGYKGAAAARAVGVSTSCGSKWFLEAGGVLIPESGPVSTRFLDQDDRIAIADVLAAQRRERARIRSEKGIRWGGRPHPDERLQILKPRTA